MHYFYLTLLVLSPIDASVSLKEKVLSILDASDNDNEKVQILQGLSKYLQDEQQKDTKDNEQPGNPLVLEILKTTPTTQKMPWYHPTTKSSTARTHWSNQIACASWGSCYTLPSFFTTSPQQITEKQKERYYTSKNNNRQEKINNTRNEIPFSKFTGSHKRRRVTEKSFFQIIPAFVTFNHRRLWEKSSASSEELKSSTKRLVRKFEPISYERPQRDVINIILPRPYGFKCGGPRQNDMLWGTCTLPEKCSAENRIYLGDNFCDKTAYICCTHRGTTNHRRLVNALKQHKVKLVNAFKDENSRFTENEDVNEADARDERKAAFIRKKLKRFKQMDFMLSLPFKKQCMDGVDLKAKKIKPKREKFKNAEYDVEFGRLYY